MHLGNACVASKTFISVFIKVTVLLGYIDLLIYLPATYILAVTVVTLVMY